MTHKLKQQMISVDEGTEKRKRKIGLCKCIHKPLIYINLEDISYQIFLLFCFSLLMMSLRHFPFSYPYH
jgi:hypothetical protein